MRRRFARLLAVTVVVGVVAAGVIRTVGLRWSPQLSRGTSPGQLSAFERAKVEWLIANRLPCRGCHVVNGSGGRLGPDLTDVARRLSRAAIDRQIRHPQAIDPLSTMPPVPMPDAWRRSLASYLSESAQAPALVSPGGKPVPVPETVGPAVSTDGATLYGRLCSGCHGAAGHGDGPNVPFLAVPPSRHADSTAMSVRSDDWLFDIIARGGYPMNRHPSMPPYGELLEPAAIRTLVAHLRQLCACAGPSWSRDGQGSRTP